ncbi:MAG TPA: hypothetical protein VGO22_03315 [Pseudorhizobium sp.]|jgi:hypothetical protein|nr:hypothetical protein [Pseudorhizobium sp.]
MNDPKKTTATQGTDDTVMPNDVADVAESGEDVNTISENTNGDGQHKIEEHAAEIEKAKQTPDREVPLSTIRMPPD